ncbi:MAG: type II toxin-antitoxin system Phd/YefM family antitoxin [Candidatus Aminicenantales bacterium]|jgi:prevent-host-death family protein
MNKIIGVTDLQRGFRKTFKEVAEDHVPYILTRGSRPEAALIPYDLYLKYVQADEDGILRRFDDFRARMKTINGRVSLSEAEKDIAGARRLVRSRRGR